MTGRTGRQQQSQTSNGDAVVSTASHHEFKVMYNASARRASRGNGTPSNMQYESNDRKIATMKPQSLANTMSTRALLSDERERHIAYPRYPKRVAAHESPNKVQCCFDWYLEHQSWHSSPGMLASYQHDWLQGKTRLRYLDSPGV